MTDLILGALLELLTPARLSFLMLGVSVGLVIGVLPGLGGIAGLSLLLPFIYGMDSTSALAMLIGLVAVIPTSDTFSSVLMGIPGSSASQATVLDGFPLARQGQAARALAAAFFASMLGGLFGALLLTGAVLAARPIILLFGSAELFMLTIFGLSTVAALSGGSLAKGVASACLGLAFGMIGSAPATGEYRMDFGTLYLSDGLALTVVGLGIFALPEMFNLLRGGGAIAERNALGTGWFQGVRDVLRNPWLVLRCSGIGALIGAIPGIGGSVVDWIAYSHAMQTTKDASRFGKGEIRGVIAPESANNATQGGALLPTLLFGIPGSGSMAIFLAGMTLIGLQPGPAMADRNLDVTYVIIWSLALANLLGTALCIVLAPGIARLTLIRYPLIAPFMLMIISFAAFQASQSAFDLAALFVVGILGLLMRRFGWSRPAFLIGFVLALGAERYLYQAVQFSGFDFMLRPLSLVILAITVLSVWVGLRRSKGQVNTEGTAQVSGGYAALAPQIAFTLLLLGIFGFVMMEGLKNSYLAALMPVVVATLGGLSVLVVLVMQLRGPVKAGGTDFDQEARATDGGPWPFVTWALGFLGLTLLVGFFLALAVFFLSFLRVFARCGWAQTLLLTACACGFVLVLAGSLSLIFPGGLLQEHYDLPWPLR
jgi:putative tricarboxylic transport membrane protein